MDIWAAKYLQEWRHDFNDELDVEQSLNFQRSVLESLKQLSSGIASTQSVATSIAAAVDAQHDQGVSLELFEAILLEAATNSPLDPAALAGIFFAFTEQNPAIAQTFKHNLASNVREGWNGPEIPTNQTERTQSIQHWVKLNAFVAHLTRLHACPLEDYAARTFNEAFDNASNLSFSCDFYIPAAATWISILGKEIYWCSHEQDQISTLGFSDSFSRDKWVTWKQGFENAARSKDVDAHTRSTADAACLNMIDLETEFHE